MLDRLGELAKIISAHAFGKSDIGTPFFADRRYVPVPFSGANFRQITPVQAGAKIRSLRSRLCGQSPQIAFIDAGNMEIFASPGLSVQFVRAYFCLLKDNKRILPDLPQKLEFFSVASAGAENGGMLFRCRLIPADSASKPIVSEIGDIALSSGEPTISRAGGTGATISVMGSVARRFAEWLYAAKIIESELEAGDILVRDGALVTAVKGEAEFAKKAYDSAEKGDTTLCACAKTSELLTSTGMPLTSSVQILAEKSRITAPWAYHPLAKNSNPEHMGEIFVCNFHEKSRRAFRFEMEKNCAQKLSDAEKADVFGAIAKNSRDGAFLGYPYGLIDADANSRISLKEAVHYRMMLLSMLKRHGSDAELLEHAVDAHDVLNEIIA